MTTRRTFSSCPDLQNFIKIYARVTLSGWVQMLLLRKHQANTLIWELQADKSKIYKFCFLSLHRLFGMPLCIKAKNKMKKNISDNLLKVSEKGNGAEWCQKNLMSFMLTVSKCQNKLLTQMNAGWIIKKFYSRRVSDENTHKMRGTMNSFSLLATHSMQTIIL